MLIKKYKLLVLSLIIAISSGNKSYSMQDNNIQYNYNDYNMSWGAFENVIQEFQDNIPLNNFQMTFIKSASRAASNAFDDMNNYYNFDYKTYHNLAQEIKEENSNRYKYFIDIQFKDRTSEYASYCDDNYPYYMKVKL